MTRTLLALAVAAGTLACPAERAAKDDPAPAPPAPVVDAGPLPPARPVRKPTARASVPADAVAATSRFVFRSRFQMNLHDRLFRMVDAPDDGGAACIEGLDDDTRAGWDDAVDAFAPLVDEGQRRLRTRLRFFRIDPDLDVDDALGPVPRWYPAALDGAEAAYRACFWHDDDAKNRAFVRALLPLLRPVEARLAGRIAQAHKVTWPTRRVDVDIVPYVNFGGGNTVRGEPGHVLVSSTASGYEGVGGVEMLFHEASHLVVGPDDGGAVRALHDAARALDVELPPPAWHVVLFFTAGHHVERAARAKLGVDYTMYMKSQGVLERAWPDFAAPLEEHWRPYLKGDVALDDAARGLVAAVAR